MLALLYGIVITVAHYVSELLRSSLHHHHGRFLSFSAGLSIAYIFLELLPASFGAVAHLRVLLFFLMLAGFSVFHLAERHIYQHQSASLREGELTGTHTYAFFLYHFFLGVLLAHVATGSLLKSFLFFVPLLFHTLASTASLSEVHPLFKESGFAKSILANSTLFGVLFAAFFPLSMAAYYGLLSFVIGVLFYVVVRDILPQGRRGDPSFFVFGVLLYSVILLLV